MLFICRSLAHFWVAYYLWRSLHLKPLKSVSLACTIHFHVNQSYFQKSVRNLQDDSFGNRQNVGNGWFNYTRLKLWAHTLFQIVSFQTDWPVQVVPRGSFFFTGVEPLEANIINNSLQAGRLWYIAEEPNCWEISQPTKQASSEGPGMLYSASLTFVPPMMESLLAGSKVPAQWLTIRTFGNFIEIPFFILPYV